jgi:hypothetical protein
VPAQSDKTTEDITIWFHSCHFILCFQEVQAYVWKHKFSHINTLCHELKSEQIKHKLRFQVLMATSMKMTVFWDAVPLSLVEIDQHCPDHGGSKHI